MLASRTTSSPLFATACSCRATGGSPTASNFITPSLPRRWCTRPRGEPASSYATRPRLSAMSFFEYMSSHRISTLTYRMNCENVVSLDTCIALQADSESTEPCMLDIKLTNNRKIARLAVVSEASILEFFKQSGEYETTVFAEFIDEFENNSVYLAETTIQPPTTEAGIKVIIIFNAESGAIINTCSHSTVYQNKKQKSYNVDIRHKAYFDRPREREKY